MLFSGWEVRVEKYFFCDAGFETSCVVIVIEHNKVKNNLIFFLYQKHNSRRCADSLRIHRKPCLLHSCHQTVTVYTCICYLYVTQVKDRLSKSFPEGAVIKG